MKIYIDFDCILFDTDKFYFEFLKICNKYGISKEEIQILIDKLFSKNSLFNLEKIVKELTKQYNLNKTFFDECMSLFDNDFVYNDVIPNLEKLYKKYELILLTYGDFDYQSKKIKSSNLKKYFNKIIITSSIKSEIENICYDEGVFIDNNPKEIERFINKSAKKVIRVRRPSDKYSKIDTKLTVSEYEDLSQLVDNELLN